MEMFLEWTDINKEKETSMDVMDNHRILGKWALEWEVSGKEDARR